MAKPPSWKLQRVEGRLALVAPHGTFFIRGVAPALEPVIAALPDGAEVTCRGTGYGINERVVTVIDAYDTDLGPHAARFSDDAVAADPRLALLRAKARIDSGDHAGAVADLAIALARDGGVDGAIKQYGRLPGTERVALRDALVSWQRRRRAHEGALGDIPLAEWTVQHLEQALKTANGASFAEVTADSMVEELERRGATAEAAHWRSTLDATRKPKPVEPPKPWFKLSTTLRWPKVIRIDEEGVHVRGVTPGTLGDQLACYSQSGAELRREPFHADASEPSKRAADRKRWTLVFANRTVDVDASATSWSKHIDWQPARAGSCRLAMRDRRLLLDEKGTGRWSVIELTRAPVQVDLAPPHIAFQFEPTRVTDERARPLPIVVVEIAALLASDELRFDNETARHCRLEIDDEKLAELNRGYERLVALDVIAPGTDAQREASVLEAWLGGMGLRRMAQQLSPFYFERDFAPIGAKDYVFDVLNRALAREAMTVTAHRQGRGHSLTLRLQHAGRPAVEAVTEPFVEPLTNTLGDLLRRLGSTRQPYAVVSTEQLGGYLLLTPEQIRGLPF